LVIEREIGVDFERGCLKVLCDWKRNRCCVWRCCVIGRVLDPLFSFT
jgi:hypothetical protein